MTDMKLEWTLLHPAADLGYIPNLLDDEDLRVAAEQINDRYSYGGGWDPTPGFRRFGDNRIQYPGDPPKEPLAVAQLRDEKLYFYRGAWLMIAQHDGSFEIARLD